MPGLFWVYREKNYRARCRRTVPPCPRRCRCSCSMRVNVRPLTSATNCGSGRASAGSRPSISAATIRPSALRSIRVARPSGVPSSATTSAPSADWGNCSAAAHPGAASAQTRIRVRSIWRFPRPSRVTASILSNGGSTPACSFRSERSLRAVNSARYLSAGKAGSVAWNTPVASSAAATTTAKPIALWINKIKNACTKLGLGSSKSM